MVVFRWHPLDRFENHNLILSSHFALLLVLEQLQGMISSIARDTLGNLSSLHLSYMQEREDLSTFTCTSLTILSTLVLEPLPIPMMASTLLPSRVFFFWRIWYFSKKFLVDWFTCRMKLLSRLTNFGLNVRSSITIIFSFIVCKPSTSFWKSFFYSSFSFRSLFVHLWDWMIDFSSSNKSARKNNLQLFLRLDFCFNTSRSSGVKATFLKNLYMCWCLRKFFFLSLDRRISLANFYFLSSIKDSTYPCSFPSSSSSYEFSYFSLPTLLLYHLPFITILQLSPFGLSKVVPENPTLDMLVSCVENFPIRVSRLLMDTSLFLWPSWFLQITSIWFWVVYMYWVKTSSKLYFSCCWFGVWVGLRELFPLHEKFKCSAQLGL